MGEEVEKIGGRIQETEKDGTMTGAGMQIIEGRTITEKSVVAVAATVGNSACGSRRDRAKVMPMERLTAPEAKRWEARCSCLRWLRLYLVIGKNSERRGQYSKRPTRGKTRRRTKMMKMKKMKEMRKISKMKKVKTLRMMKMMNKMRSTYETKKVTKMEKLMMMPRSQMRRRRMPK